MRGDLVLHLHRLDDRDQHPLGHHRSRLDRDLQHRALHRAAQRIAAAGGGCAALTPRAGRARPRRRRGGAVAARAHAHRKAAVADLDGVVKGGLRVGFAELVARRGRGLGEPVVVLERGHGTFRLAPTARLRAGACGRGGEGGDSADPVFADRAEHALRRSGAIGVPDDQLGDQGVVGVGDP